MTFPHPHLQMGRERHIRHPHVPVTHTNPFCIAYSFCVVAAMLGHQKIRFLSKWKENCDYPVPTRHERTVSTEINTITSEIFPRVDED